MKFSFIISSLISLILFHVTLGENPLQKITCTVEIPGVSFFPGTQEIKKNKSQLVFHIENGNALVSKKTVHNGTSMPAITIFSEKTHILKLSDRMNLELWINKLDQAKTEGDQLITHLFISLLKLKHPIEDGEVMDNKSIHYDSLSALMNNNNLTGISTLPTLSEILKTSLEQDSLLRNTFETFQQTKEIIHIQPLGTKSLESYTVLKDINKNILFTLVAIGENQFDLLPCL